MVTGFVFEQNIAAKDVLANCPDLSLMGLDQEEHHVCEYIGNGKWTMVNIWGPKCPTCVEETPDLVLFHETHYQSDAIVLGIALDFPSYGYANLKEVTEFVENHFIDYPMLLADRQVAKQLGGSRLKGIPATLVFTPDGELVREHIGIITKAGMEQFMVQR